MHEIDNATLPEHLQIKAVATPTRGERAYDFLKYKVVNLALNWMASVAIMDLFLGSKVKPGQKEPSSFFASIAPKGKIGDAFRKGTDGLRNFYDKMESGVASKMGHFAGRTVADLFSLNVGGHIMAVAVKLMENKNEKNTRKLDKWLDKLSGHKPSEEQLAMREARYEVIQQTPVKTWGKVIMGRISGMLFNMGFYSGIELLDKNFSKMEPTKATADIDSKRGLRRLTQGFSNIVYEKLEPLAKNDMAKKRINYWAEIMPFDLMCTWSLSTVMEKFIKRGDKEKPKPNVIVIVNKDHKTAENSNSASAPAELPAANQPARSWSEKTARNESPQAATDVAVNI